MKTGLRWNTNRRLHRTRLHAEELESRRLLAFDPSGMEQEMFEHLNRMRIDPQGELDVFFLSTDPADGDYFVSPDSDVNIALGYFGTDASTLFSQWSSLTPVSPLAWSEALYDAAEAHNLEMVSFNTQSHQLPGEASLLDRAVDAGYNWTGSVSVGENVFAYTESMFHGHSAFAIDWGNTSTGIQDPPGHRINMMKDTWVEVGISAIESTPNQAGDVGPLLVTQDFGYRGNYAGPKVLGVVYSDTDADGLYDAGEGESNISIEISNGSNTYTTTTMTAGGYQIQVPAGTYTVTASGGTLTGTVHVGTVTVSSDNEKVDLETTSIPTDGTIAGTLFHDENQDGIQNGFDVGLSDYSVYLDANNNGLLDTGEVATTTNEHGDYSLPATAGITHIVRYQLPEFGVSASSGGVASYSITPTIGVTDSNNDFALFRILEVDGATITAYGSSGDDNVNFTVGLSHSLSINGEVFSLSSLIYDTVVIKAGGGTDTLNVTASTASDTATLRQADAVVSGSGYGLQADDFENVNVDLNGGESDYAYLYDGELDDDLISHTTWGRLKSTDYNHYVEDFDRMYTYALAGGNDRAYVYDGPTDDRFIGRKDFSIIHGNNNEFYTYMEGFERNFGYSTQGGTDYAFFYDSPGNDNFFGRAEYGVMQDSAVSYFNYASGFDRVFAYAYNGGTDHAYLTDGATDDVFYSRETLSILRGKNFEFHNQVHSFERVYAYARNGGLDDAYFFDTASDDTFRAYSDYAMIVNGNGHFGSAQTFEQVVAYSNNGGYDSAFYYDSSGHDLFYARNGYGYMAGPGYFNRTDNWEEVTIDGSNGGVNTLNVASLDFVLATEGTWV